MPRLIASWPIKFLSKLRHWGLPALVLLPVLWALLPGGLPNSGDGMVHFARIIEVVLSWRDGVYLPRWSLNLGFGYGIPVFIFGPPLAYWLGALYNVVGLGPEAAYKAMLVTVLLIGAAGAYRLGRVLLGMWAGVVATVAFVYAPNQLFTLFVQGNAPQLLAWGFMLWSLWATIKIYQGQIYHTPSQMQRWGYVLALALAMSATLISHNVVSLILVPTVAMLTLILWVATRNTFALGSVAAGGVLGGMMGAWFVIPALLEIRYASTAAIAATDYRDHFVPLLELLAWPPRIDAGAINPYMPRTLGLPVVIVALIGVIFLVGWMVARRTSTLDSADSADSAGGRRVFWASAVFMLLYALFCGWMATRWSGRVWELLPMLALLQFPARWIGFAGFGLAWLAAAAAGLVDRRVQPTVAAALCLFLFASALVNLYPDKTPAGTRSLSAYEVVRYEVRSGAVGTTSYGEFNPRWAPRPLPYSPMVEDYMAQRPIDRLKGMLPPEASHRILEVNAHLHLYAIILPAPTQITLNLLYFPGWTGRVNGVPVEVAPQAETGLITVALPAGENVLELAFGPTPLRRAMGLLSGAAWVVWLLACVALIMGRTRRARDQHSGYAGGTREVRGAILLSAVVGVTILLHSMGAEWFQLRSAPDQALAAPVPRHEDVGDHFRLLGQSLLPRTIRAGAVLPVVGYWRALVDMDENYSAVLRVVDVATGQPLVEMEQAHPNNIPTSGWATGLYVRNAWQVPIPADALPMQYAVRATFRHPLTGELLPAGASADGVELGRLWVLPQVEPDPPDGPRARFGASIELVGAAVEGEALTLYWRADTEIDAPIGDDYSIFVHLLDANGEVLGQLDGLPFANRYPTWAWRPQQVIEDRRDVTAASVDPTQIDRIAVGVYHVASGERLSAVDGEGQTLADNALLIDRKN